MFRNEQSDTAWKSENIFKVQFLFVTVLPQIELVDRLEGWNFHKKSKPTINRS